MRCARPRVGVVRKRAGMIPGDVQYDRAGFEQHENALLVSRYLAERVQRAMRGSLHRLE